MLISSHVVSVDAKGRVSVPAQFREYLRVVFGDDVVLLGKDGCICVYPLREWKRRFSDKLKYLSTSNKKIRNYLRRLYGSAHPCKFDRQGRILLSSKLRENFKIQQEAVIVGIENKLEIWGREEWDKEIGGVFDGEFGGPDESLDEDSVEFEF